jgi:hypothetical protein
MLVEERVHDRLVELVVTESVTVPAKPFKDATTMVDVPATLILVETVVALAVRLKSWTRNVTVAECNRLPLVPVTVAR